MSQLLSAFLIDKGYTGSMQVEGYVRKQSKQSDQMDKSIYFRIDLQKKQFERAPSKLDFNKQHKIVLFSDILQIHSTTQENQKPWGFYITFEYKTKMKRQLTLILETAQLYQLFTSALSSIYDSTRKVHLLVNKQQQLISSSNQDEYLTQQNIPFATSDPAKLTIKRRVDIYKKRNQSASSTRQNNQILNQTCNLHEEQGKRQIIDNPYSQEISKKSLENSQKSQEIVLDQYQNHFFGRCVNRVIKTVVNPEVSKVLQENQENKNVIKPKNEKITVEVNSQNTNKSSQIEVGRKNFRYSNQNYGNADQQNQNVSQTVPQTNIHTKRPSIITERDQGNQVQYNSIATPYNQTLSTITPRHSSISARSRKYKRQKNISFDSGNPSQTLNFYAESSKKGNILDKQIDKLNKTTLMCNYYEPNIDVKKQENEIHKNQKSEQIQGKDEHDFYPSFAKNYTKNQRVTTMNEQDQQEWSLASIQSPKIKPDDNKKESIHQFFPEQKKIKIIRKRSSKLGNTIEDEIESEQQQQSQQTTLTNQNSSFLKSNHNHLLSNLSNFKVKTEQNKEYIQDQKEQINVKDKALNLQEQSSVIKQQKEEQVETPIQIQQNQQIQQDTFNAHKEQLKQNHNTKQQQENFQQMQHSSLLRPNSSQNVNQNTSSPKKYGNIPKPQSGQKSGQKNVDVLKFNDTSDNCTQVIQQKPQMNAYFKQLYDFNLNKEMQDEILTDNENVDIDSYKIILQNETKNTDEDYTQKSKINKEYKNIEQEKKKSDLDMENSQYSIQDKPKSLSPLKNQTNKIQQQIFNQKQEILSYQFNQQNNDNQFYQNENLSKNQKNQITKALQQSQLENSPKNQHQKKNSNRLDTNEKITKSVENQNQQQMSIKQQIQQQSQDNNQAQQQDSSKTKIKEAEQNVPVEYHDFDNSFDKDDEDIEMFSQINKVDEIIKIIEEKTCSVLRNNNEQDKNTLKKCNQLIQNETDKTSQINRFDEIENQLQQNNLQQTEQDQTLESNRSSPKQTENNSLNYDWNCMKDPNYKPTTSPLKERLFMVEEEGQTSQQKENPKPIENDSKQSELMIVMVNKNQNTQQKKKEKPILRQRDVFSDEFWNPVTNPRNYKVTNQPPNLNETKQTNKQVVVPVKVSCQNDDQELKDGNKEQNKFEQTQKNGNKSKDNHNETDNKNIQNYKVPSQQNTNLFDEVKDFFKVQAKARENVQKQQQLQHFDNSSNQRDSQGNNNQIKTQNNYDDWDDYY
ncbi:hypothetical protein ABPG74_014392 [Tetrahymena malaccensis]